MMSMFRLRINAARLVMIAGGWLAVTICPELIEPEDRSNDR